MMCPNCKSLNTERKSRFKHNCKDCGHQDEFWKFDEYPPNLVAQAIADFVKQGIDEDTHFFPNAENVSIQDYKKFQDDKEFRADVLKVLDILIPPLLDEVIEDLEK